MADTVAHPLEPLSAPEVRAAVRILTDTGKVAPITRFVSVALREPSRSVTTGYRG